MSTMKKATAASHCKSHFDGTLLEEAPGPLERITRNLFASAQARHYFFREQLHRAARLVRWHAWQLHPHHQMRHPARVTVSLQIPNHIIRTSHRQRSLKETETGCVAHLARRRNV